MIGVIVNSRTAFVTHNVHLLSLSVGIEHSLKEFLSNRQLSLKDDYPTVCNVARGAWLNP